MSTETMSFARGRARNPLGIIALFIFLIYSIASLVLSVSADALTPGQKWVFILFLVIFPLFVLGAFVWLVANQAVKLYSPSDFRDDHSYVSLNQKLEIVEARQRAAQIDPRGNAEDAKETLALLMSLNLTDTAKSVAKAFLKVGRYGESLRLFEQIEAHSKRAGEESHKVFSYRAYCLIGLGRYDDAMGLLRRLQVESEPDFDFWPQMAMSYCAFKLRSKAEFKTLLSQAVSCREARDNIAQVRERYQEIASDFEGLLAQDAS